MGRMKMGGVFFVEIVRGLVYEMEDVDKNLGPVFGLYGICELCLTSSFFSS